SGASHRAALRRRCRHGARELVLLGRRHEAASRHPGESRPNLGQELGAHGRHPSSSTYAHCHPRLAPRRKRRGGRAKREHSGMSKNLFNTSFNIPSTSPVMGGPNPPSICPGDLPLVLLPVRLETRFFTLSGGATELRVRVFPDRIHIDSHERDLTAGEQTW